MLKVLLWIGVGVAALFTVALFVLAGGPMPSIPPRKVPPPDGFVASDFVAMTEMQSVAGIDVINLSRYGGYFENYYLPEPKVVWFMMFGKATDFVYVFVSASGEVLGTIETDERLASMGTVFLGLDGYYEITSTALNGPLPYASTQHDLEMSQLRALYESSTYYREISFRDVAHTRPEYEAELDTHLFLQDGAWTKVQMAGAEYLDWKTPPFVNLSAQYDFAPETAVSFYDGVYKFERTHFDQQEFFGKRPAPMGSTTGIGRAAHWRGTGYYTVHVGDADLRFQVPQDRWNISGSGPVYLGVEGHEDLDFLFVKYQTSSENTHAYIISQH